MKIDETTRSPAVVAISITAALVVPANPSMAEASPAYLAVGSDAFQTLWLALAAGRMLVPLAQDAAPAAQHEALHDQQSPSASRSLSTRPDFGARARRVHTALTEREREVLCLVAGGATNHTIASRLFISPKTASVHVSRILTKLDATTRTEAAALAHASGLVRFPDVIAPQAVTA